MVSKHKATWKVFINSSSNFEGSGKSVVIMDDKQIVHEYSIQITFLMTNNIVEYKAAFLE